MKVYEIHNLTTNEVVAYDLSFNDVPELIGAYMDFFPEYEFVACYKDSNITVTLAKPMSQDEINRRNFNADWFDFMDELVAMDNLH